MRRFDIYEWLRSSSSILNDSTASNKLDRDKINDQIDKTHMTHKRLVREMEKNISHLAEYIPNYSIHLA